MADAIFPIWKDEYYTANESASPLSYYIQVLNGTVVVNGQTVENWETIFNGKAWAAPEEETLSINLNRIYQDHLDISLPNDFITYTATTSCPHTKAVRRFRIMKASDNSVLENNIAFFNWSYELPVLVDNELYAAAPINGHYMNDMFFFRTKYAFYSLSSFSAATVVTKDPTIGFMQDPYGNRYYDKEVCPNNSGFALYYLNRYGGYDAFLIEQKVTKTDNYVKYYTDRVANNNTIEFAKKAYHSEITTAWELNTGWLTDEQSERLAFHLLSSNQVYLHDIANSRFYPVVITDANATYKTRKNQNHRMYNYTINVEASQTQQNI